MPEPSAYTLALPADFDDRAWEVEAKGWYPSAIATIHGQTYGLTFYDPVRLSQDIEEELKRSPVHFESNILVVPSVTRANMERAIELLVRDGRYRRLTPH